MVKVNAKSPVNERFEFDIDNETGTVKMMYDTVGEYVKETGKKLSDFTMKLIFAGRILQDMDEKVCNIFPKGSETVGIIFLLQKKPIEEVALPPPPPSPVIAPVIAPAVAPARGAQIPMMGM